jgi:hypothetical protein
MESLDQFFSNHFYNQTNRIYKTKRSIIILLPTVIHVNSFPSFSEFSRKTLKRKYKEIYDTPFYDSFLFFSTENDMEPYVNNIIAKNISIQKELITEGFSTGTYQICTLLKDDGTGEYSDTAVVPLGANIYESGGAMFTYFLYFLLIFVVVGILSPYLTILGIKTSKSLPGMLTFLGYVILLIGFILIITGFTKKQNKGKNALLVTLGFYFVVMFIVSVLSNMFAFRSKLKFSDDLDFGTIDVSGGLGWIDFFDIYGMKHIVTPKKNSDATGDDDGDGNNA